MEQPSISKLRFFSLGIVAANKKLSSDTIEVTAVEEFPMLHGEITDTTEEYKADTVDQTGAAKSTSLKSTVTVSAKWLPINNSNRRTPPDVRRGERVVIYQLADADEYWWNTLMNDATLRRLETVIYAFSNNSKEGATDDATSTYFLEVSTHRKLVHFHTSKNDGEPFSYDVQINAKDGIVTITDDADNFFVLNSRDKRLTMQNGDGSVVDIDKTSILLSATEAVNIKTSAFSVQADTTSVKAGSNTVEGPTDFSDMVGLNGGFGASGGGGTTGTITGNVKVNGKLTATDLEEG